MLKVFLLVINLGNNILVKTRSSIRPQLRVPAFCALLLFVVRLVLSGSWKQWVCQLQLFQSGLKCLLITSGHSMCNRSFSFLSAITHVHTHTQAQIAEYTRTTLSFGKWQGLYLVVCFPLSLSQILRGIGEAFEVSWETFLSQLSPPKHTDKHPHEHTHTHSAQGSNGLVCKIFFTATITWGGFRLSCKHYPNSLDGLWTLMWFFSDLFNHSTHTHTHIQISTQLLPCGQPKQNNKQTKYTLLCGKSYSLSRSGTFTFLLKCCS